MRLDGRFLVMRCLTLGEPGSLEVGVTNPEDGSNTTGHCQAQKFQVLQLIHWKDEYYQ